MAIPRQVIATQSQLLYTWKIKRHYQSDSAVYQQKMKFKEKKEKFPIKSEAHSFLWAHKLKATKPRLELFELLSKEKEPISAAKIYKKILSKTTRSTVFRALEDLCKVDLVAKIRSSNDNQSLYEMRFGRKHHHHVTCTSCGEIEDVAGCDAQELDASASARLKKFKSVQSHSLEFFGLCKKCADK